MAFLLNQKIITATKTRNARISKVPMRNPQIPSPSRGLNTLWVPKIPSNFKKILADNDGQKSDFGITLRDKRGIHIKVYDDYYKALNCEYDCVTQFCANEDDDHCDKKCKQLCGEVF